VTQVVVDASILVAALMADGSARHTLLHSGEVEFVVPAFIFEEVERNMDRIVARARLPSEIVATLVDDLRSRIEVVPRGAYSDALDEARVAAEKAGAMGDEDYVALAVTLNAPVWSFDRDFLRIPGVRHISTREIAEIGTERSAPE
jgi:predicted nucleic acid-binding protein